MMISKIRGGVNQVALNLDKCKNIEGEIHVPLEFGVSEIASLCGRVKTEAQELSNSQEYTKFFKDRCTLKDKTGVGNEDSDEGKKQCEGQTGIKGVILSSSSNSGTQYLGLCSDSEVKDTKFVKKVQQPGMPTSEEEYRDKGTLGVCENNCGKTDTGAIMGSTITLEEENSNNGKEIQFYKK